MYFNKYIFNFVDFMYFNKYILENISFDVLFVSLILYIIVEGIKFNFASKAAIEGVKKVGLAVITGATAGAVKSIADNVILGDNKEIKKRWPLRGVIIIVQKSAARGNTEGSNNSKPESSSKS